MATRPGTIKEIVDVTMPHPRDRSSTLFVALEREIKRLVREEVAKLGVTERRIRCQGKNLAPSPTWSENGRCVVYALTGRWRVAFPAGA